MTKRDLLLQRLEEIITAARATNQCLAVLANGSAGPDLDRLDDFSDLDLIFLVRAGAKHGLLTDLDWLGFAHPISYALRVSADTVKLLFEDDVFCELGVFGEEEFASESLLQGGWSAPTRTVWAAPGFAVAEHLPPRVPPAPPQRSVAWRVGEALTNLYTGLDRYRRGEKLSAARFVQGYALDRVAELAADLAAAQQGSRDPWLVERRFEQRFPQAARLLPAMMQGYSHTPASAAAILAFLCANFEVAPAMKAAIEARLAALEEG